MQESRLEKISASSDFIKRMEDGSRNKRDISQLIADGAELAERLEKIKTGELEQKRILEERTQEYQEDGLSYQAAYDKALETVALPGYSEHETGLAMDIVCSVTPTWLHEHCWEYGFILRYPEDKSSITGISYEHWHYRYVGTKVSMAMKDTGLCLEEYVGAV